VKVFVTVGTQLPFDRLVKAVDELGALYDWDILAQIGQTRYQPRHLEWRAFVDTETAAGWIRDSDLVITHAGMGTILGRLEAGGPMLVMPRKASLGEHRNEHQRASCARLGHFPSIHVVEDADELREAVASFQPARRSEPIGKLAQPALVEAIRDYVWRDFHKPDFGHSDFDLQGSRKKTSVVGG
jgi:UDP-N-acetylglucosamine transferase subunit ALG13